MAVGAFQLRITGTCPWNRSQARPNDAGAVMSHLKVVAVRYGVKSTGESVEKVEAFRPHLAEIARLASAMTRIALAGDDSAVAHETMAWISDMVPVALATQDLMEAGLAGGRPAREERIMLAVCQMAIRDTATSFELFDNLVRTTYGTEPICELALMLLAMIDMSTDLKSGMDCATLAERAVEFRRTMGILGETLDNYCAGLERPVPNWAAQ